jgi:hypothetical protein
MEMPMQDITDTGVDGALRLVEPAISQVLHVSGRCVELLGEVTRGALAASCLVDKFLEEDLGTEERARLERLNNLLKGRGAPEDFPRVPEMTQRAKLRVCGRCSWIFEGNSDCPKCGFATYGARYVFGDACYGLKKTQRRWFDYQMALRASELRAEIAEANEARPRCLVEPDESLPRDTVQIRERDTGRVLGELRFGKAEATLQLIDYDEEVGDA